MIGRKGLRYTFCAARSGTTQIVHTAGRIRIVAAIDRHAFVYRFRRYPPRPLLVAPRPPRRASRTAKPPLCSTTVNSCFQAQGGPRASACAHF